MAEIVKGKIGNALTSTAADHTVAVADDIYDEELEQYQGELNRLAAIKDEDGNVVESPFSIVSNDEYLHAIVDSENRLLFGIRNDGKVALPKQDMYNVVQNDEYLYAITDAEGKLLIGIRNDGEIIECNIPLKTRQEIEDVKTELSRNVLAVEMDRDTGQIIGYTGNDSRITSCVQDRVTGIITINQVIE